MSKKIKITLIKSPIGYRSKFKKTLTALGLKRLHQTIEVEDSSSMKGMINSINFLLKIEDDK